MSKLNEMKTGKWMYNLTGSETWFGDFYDTKEEAITAGKEELKEDNYLDTDSFDVGQLIVHVPYISADEIIENIGERAFDECGEIAEDYLCSISKKNEQLLEERLNNILMNWLHDIGQMPWFGSMKNVETIHTEV